MAKPETGRVIGPPPGYAKPAARASFTALPIKGRERRLQGFGSFVSLPLAGRVAQLGEAVAKLGGGGQRAPTCRFDTAPCPTYKRRIMKLADRTTSIASRA